MKTTFWLSLALIAYTYLGYPVWLYLRSRWKPIPILKGPILPSVSIVMAVHNEAAVLPAKLADLKVLDYPLDKIEIVVASDGSNDATDQILAAHAGPNLRTVICAERQGKAAAMNQALAVSKGDIVVFVDARQMIEPAALRHLVSNFADPTVGCVSGELMFGDFNAGTLTSGLGLYWNIEKRIRQWEAASSSTVGATGALYAVRRRLVPELPTGTVLDDLYIPMHVVRTARVVFEPEARAWDLLSPTDVEFARKVRTLTGNYQLLQLAPWVLTPSNPILFQFFSHKLCRLLVPFALGWILLSGLVNAGIFYRASAALLIISFMLATASFFHGKLGVLSRAGNFALTFLLLNTAAAIAFVNFIFGRKVAWRPQAATDGPQK